VGVVAILLTSARLALVVSATPQSLWLSEYPLLTVPAGRPVDAATVDRAERVSRLISDSHLVTARLAPCRSTREAARIAAVVEDFDNATTDCLRAIDAGLAADPASGELWYARSQLLFDLGRLDEFVDSLRRSYRSAPREGWIISSRAVLGVSALPLLPEDLRADVRNDVDLALSDYRLADGLIAAVVADPKFRALALPIVEDLSADRQEWFLQRVRAELAAKGEQAN
jgi:tetratricopeptide (TPR) repeat protein